MPRRLALALIAILAACSSRRPEPGGRTGAATFPALPTTPADLDALIAKETRRPPPESEPALDAARILAAAEAHGFARLPTGDAAVTRWIQAALDRTPGDAYLLFGTWHDAPGQIDAFRRLVGPGGLRGLHLVAAEQFRADGEWQGVPLDAQRGDTPLLDLYVDRGDPAAFAKLAEQHRDADYAAWKLGYEPAVLDLVVNARATRVRFAGCDMPAALQDRSGAPPGDPRNRLREIHCLRSLPITWPRRAALLWGDAHLRASGLLRFLPTAAGAVRIHAIGRRSGEGDVEAALAKHLVVNDPVIVPLGPDEAALLLPDTTLGGTIDRVLTAADDASSGVVATSAVPGTLTIRDHVVPLASDPVAIQLPAGDHTYAFSSGGLRIVGALHLGPKGRVDLAFDPTLRFTRYAERASR